MALALLTLLWACGGGGDPGCPEGMVRIPAGTAKMGVSGETRPWQESAREVTLPAYCIDRYEFPNQKDLKPRNQVSAIEAGLLCERKEKRLCTSVEWERACRGPEGRTYSYGATRNGETCNTPFDGVAPGSPPFPIAASGVHPDCRSPEGVYDLNGNLSEWVSDPWTGEAEPFQAEAIVDAETWRTLRGGTMWRPTFYGQDCTSRHGHSMFTEHQDDGFRCCADVVH